MCFDTYTRETFSGQTLQSMKHTKYVLNTPVNLGRSGLRLGIRCLKKYTWSRNSECHPGQFSIQLRDNFTYRLESQKQRTNCQKQGRENIDRNREQTVIFKKHLVKTCCLILVKKQGAIGCIQIKDTFTNLKKKEFCPKVVFLSHEYIQRNTVRTFLWQSSTLRCTCRRQGCSSFWFSFGSFCANIFSQGQNFPRCNKGKCFQNCYPIT